MTETKTRKRTKVTLEEETAGEKYFARRSLKLFGVSYKAGDRIPREAIDSLPRVESLIRSGLVSMG